MNRISSLAIYKDFNLKAYNTFGMDVKASDFAKIDSEKQIPELLREINGRNEKVLFLGGGSNVLFAGNYEGLVVHIATKGIEIVDQDDEFVYVSGMAGENWNDFVQYCVLHNFGGLENLSLIPGNVGSAPIQNIGAYGVEIKDTFYMLDAVSLKSGEFREFSNAECRFGYRNSIFKSELKGQYLILSVTFRLEKKPTINTTYGAINEQLAMMKKPADIRSVAEAVINIRTSKLPDPKEIGNAGSFFKNPVISMEKFLSLKEKYPDIPSYPSVEGVKLAAGWMIEKCGWKGYREGDAGVHKNQALVLVNYGNASGKEIVSLASRIILSVNDKFGIHLEPEVNIV
ncbi:MAG: UDP-N-acetylmuramate dehydrogenase [Lentimicrobium sp.]|nr:UDP-N-acetylmuramate dehydrogenase [Lentimicrobium sp.]